MRTHIDLFSGIGGFALAAKWNGFETVQFCEREPYCQKLLAQHWPGVSICDDIHNLKGEYCDLLTGGFPCQPYSLAGKRRGAADDRALWPEMLRVIKEGRPRWVVGENVSGFVKMGLDQAIFDLEAVGYSCWSFIVPAVGVDARHNRDRVWIVAHSTHARAEEMRQWEKSSIDTGGDNALADTKRDECRKGRFSGGSQESIERSETPVGGCNASQTSGCCEAVADTYGNDVQGSNGGFHDQEEREVTGKRPARLFGAGRGDEDVADTECCGLQGQGEPVDTKHQEAIRGWETNFVVDGGESRFWPAEPGVGRVAHGVSNRVDRIKSLGNAIVPQVAAEIIRCIVETEKQQQ